MRWVDLVAEKHRALFDEEKRKQPPCPDVLRSLARGYARCRKDQKLLSTADPAVVNRVARYYWALYGEEIRRKDHAK